jgi:hypothetical protein
MPDVDQPFLGQLLRDVSSDLRALGTVTAQLAQAEVGAATSTLKLALILGAIGIVVVVGGVLVLLSALVLTAMALGLPPWAAAASVALILIGIGVGMAWMCLTRLRRVEWTLRETRASLMETWQWLKTETSR